MFLPLAAFAGFIYFSFRRQLKRLLTNTSLFSGELSVSRRPKNDGSLRLTPERKFCHA